MTTARHLMIRASAGSGKTYRLTDRVVELLEAGANPERIVALTFTRKAAGEFFDAILARLASRAEESPATHLPLLRQVIDSMPRLRLSTMDAFFAQVVRGFPFELGLTGDFELLQEHAAQLERRRVLRRMYTRSQGGLQSAQREFIEAFKLATMGTEEKRLAAKLDSFLDEHHQVFLSASAAGLWGDSDRIWPEGATWRGAPTDASPALRILREWAEAAPIGDKQRERWLDFCAALKEWAPGVPPPREMAYVLERVLEDLDEFRQGTARPKFDRREQPLSSEASRAVADLALSVLAQEYLRHIAMTQGIQKLLSHYETFYHEAVRRGGRLTFADIQRLLEPMRLHATGDMAPQDGRLAIDYRLDGGVDHWLLDEFQDTSFGQWSVLENLIDEVISDPSETRTFFCVGDVKQAIYRWRQGDHRLFGEILAKYNGAVPGTIAEEPLLKSWRSAPPVIDLVNGVFGQPAVLDSLFPGPASAQWNREWNDHSSARLNLPGQAALLLAEDEPARWKVMLDVLLEINPVERGLSCAVLVLNNQAAEEIADYLRREGGLPAVAEADLHVCADNPVGAALLALAQAVDHPEDRLAWAHVRMSPPLAAVLDRLGWSTPESLCTALLPRFQNDGYARTLAALLAEVAESFPAGDQFNPERAKQWVAAAANFDESGGRSAAEFVDFMERYTLREPESAAVIRVMTVHKSKGLGFDVVILPDLKGKTLLDFEGPLAVQRRADRQVEWILDLPSKLFADGDPVIRAHVEAQKAENCYERLAVLYVALTRAKQGLYVVAEPLKPSSESKNYHRLLADTLGAGPIPVKVGGLSLTGAWQAGRSDWYLDAPAAPPAPAAGKLLPIAGPTGAPRLMAHRPSAEETAPFGLESAFSLDVASAAEFGSVVHALLAEVEWADASEREAQARRWRERNHPLHEAARAAAACLLAPENQSIWEKPEGRAEVWRERSFEMAEGVAWYSGTFDRVIVRRAEDGTIRAVEVIDFKTVRGEPGPEKYQAQLDTYRRAASRLTPVPLAAIGARLVWIRL